MSEYRTDLLVKVKLYIFYGDNIIFSLDRWLNPSRDEWYLPHESFLVVSKVFNKPWYNVCIPSKNTKSINQETLAVDSEANAKINEIDSIVYCMDMTLPEFQETQKRIEKCIKGTPVEKRFGYLFERISKTRIYDKLIPRLSYDSDSDISSDDWPSDDED